MEPKNTEEFICWDFCAENNLQNIGELTFYRNLKIGQCSPIESGEINF